MKKYNRDKDHIRHASTDGVFAKVAQDVAMAAWERDERLKSFPDIPQPQIDFEKIIIDLLCALSGETEINVRVRLTNEIGQCLNTLEQQAFIMRNSLENK